MTKIPTKIGLILCKFYTAISYESHRVLRRGDLYNFACGG